MAEIPQGFICFGIYKLSNISALLDCNSESIEANSNPYETTFIFFEKSEDNINNSNY